MKYAFSSPFAVTEAFASPSADVRIGPVELLRLDGSRLTMKDHAAHRATAVLFLSTRCGASEAARETIRGSIAGAASCLPAFSQIRRKTAMTFSLGTTRRTPDRRCTSPARPPTARPGTGRRCWYPIRASFPAHPFFKPATAKPTSSAPVAVARSSRSSTMKLG